MNEDYFTIALPAGRLAQESIAFFQQAGLTNIEIPAEGRSLLLTDPKQRLCLILARGQDVPTIVLQGGADVGITGRDILDEGNYDLTIPLQLNFGHCRLSFAAQQERSSRLKGKGYLRVATKYPRLAADYFYHCGLNCEIIKMHGSVEIAPALGIADCIVDLVSSGQTLRDNGLVELATIAHYCAVLVVSRSSYALKTERIAKLLHHLQQALSNG